MRRRKSLEKETPKELFAENDCRVDGAPVPPEKDQLLEWKGENSRVERIDRLLCCLRARQVLSPGTVSRSSVPGK